MKKLILSIFLVFLVAAAAQAIPTIQVGAPAGPGDSGSYADYQGSLMDPTETDTAITSGSILKVAGLYKNNDVLQLGGQYSGTYGTGDNWTKFGFDSAFNSAGAVLMATAPVTSGGSLTVNGLGSIYSTNVFESGFVVPNPPANHAPINGTGLTYLFFNIGNFTNTEGVVQNLVDETGSFNGEIKTIAISASGYDWIHFDAFALETVLEETTVTVGKGKNKQTYIITSLALDDKGNPGSHDVTWKRNTPVPEPGTIMLLGSGLAGVAALGRKRFKK